MRSLPLDSMVSLMSMGSVLMTIWFGNLNLVR
jgi:hypothetical protein